MRKPTKNPRDEYFLSALVVSSGIVLLLNFIRLIQGGGEMLVYERNKTLLWVETVGAGAMICYGGYRFLQSMKS